MLLHLGFGEAGQSASPALTGVLRRQPAQRLRSVAGSLEAREAAAGWFTRRGLATAPCSAPAAGP
jgi:aspartate aminotransferase